MTALAAALGGVTAAVAAAPPPAVAADILIPFTPPLDRPLRFETVTQREAAGEPVTLRVVREVLFTRAGSGYRAESRVVARDYAGPEALRMLIEAASPTAGPGPLLFDIDAQARIRPVATDAGWAAVRDSVARMVESAGVTPGSLQAIGLAQLRGWIDGLDAEGRAALLCGEIAPLLAYAGRPAATVAEEGTPLAVTGKDAAVLRLSGDGSGAAIAVEVDRASGLVLRSERRITTQFGDRDRLVVTRTAMLDAPPVY